MSLLTRLIMPNDRRTLTVPMINFSIIMNFRKVSLFFFITFSNKGL